jgi:hypothetical protein
MYVIDMAATRNVKIQNLRKRMGGRVDWIDLALDRDK